MSKSFLTVHAPTNGHLLVAQIQLRRREAFQAIAIDIHKLNLNDNAWRSEENEQRIGTNADNRSKTNLSSISFTLSHTINAQRNIWKSTKLGPMYEPSPHRIS